MKISEHPQGSEQWKQARCGIPTASDFGQLVTPEGKVRTGQMPKSYAIKKVAEAFLGHPEDTGFSQAMERGTLLETRAIPMYELMSGKKAQRVGLCLTDDGRVGASPDALLGDDSGIEAKCCEGHTHVEYLIGGCVPPDHVAQVQGCMWVTGRPRWVFLAYNPYLPPLIVNVEADPVYQAAITEALAQFFARFDAARAKVEAMQPQGGRS